MKNEMTSKRKIFDTKSKFFLLCLMFFAIAITLLGFSKPKIKNVKKGINQRIISQNSYFSIHNGPTTLLIEDFERFAIERIIIPMTIKKDIIFRLNHLGINYYTLFPDLEGLGKHLAWVASNKKYFDNLII